MTRAAVRQAVAGDLPGILDVYNQHVVAGMATFDLVPVTLEDRQAWFEGFSGKGPHRLFVADIAGEVVGFASSTPFRGRAGYRHTVETSVYVHPDHHGEGLGMRLMMGLMQALDDEGVHRAVAAVALPNDASVTLHERLGFQEVGTMDEVGRKFDEWVDVRWYIRRGP